MPIYLPAHATCIDYLPIATRDIVALFILISKPHIISPEMGNGQILSIWSIISDTSLSWHNNAHPLATALWVLLKLWVPLISFGHINLEDNACNQVL